MLLLLPLVGDRFCIIKSYFLLEPPMALLLDRRVLLTMATTWLLFYLITEISWNPDLFGRTRYCEPGPPLAVDAFVFNCINLLSHGVTLLKTYRSKNK